MNVSTHFSETTQRSLHVDVWRGGACILMILYHFCYDLNYLKIITFDFYHNPFWLTFRTLIVSLFIGIAGISLHLATLYELRIHVFIKRLVILLGCAGLISAVSFILFHERFIFFGILHFIALASVLGLFFRRWFWFNIITGSGLLIIGINVQHSLFNHNMLQWIGLMTHKPATEDYVPLLPWFGLMLLGMALGKYCHNTGFIFKPLRLKGGQQLAWIGQHSLLVYMLHQPFLLGILWVLK
ncbi:heparan-alpha-glucosaminide N-acetyltransferase [Candidatus Parabeggiatoa sp. HSG14]|uniref:DUF1624 domain-containing protein n=1 Tax=Candidatus Parabeggiatoa sp. HSG14 TaxID=3055593 RepID=UPI0025A708F9|nr:heparan-alpha-glucosaminide N-acetyltransferase [Thiotrichales bacterium HSG14]